MSQLSVESSATEVVLEARGISKAFPGVQALDKVDITVRRGRLNALLGENGAGKSTLMSILAGALSMDEGTLYLDGQPVRLSSPREAQDAGIAVIYQELNLVPELSVAENIFLGREPRNRFGFIDYRALHAQSAALISQLELDADAYTRVAGLRVAAQQVVEIAKALAFRARIVIMDEPTSTLSMHETELLFRLIAQLKQAGVGIIYITHRLDELNHIADDVTVFRDGRLIGTAPYSSVTRGDLIAMMVGRELSPAVTKQTLPPSEEAMRVRGLTLHTSANVLSRLVDDISFAVRRGEVVGLFGLVGAGRTELLQTIFGLHPHTSHGEIWIAGRRVTIRSPQAAIHNGIAYVPEDRKADGLVMSMSVAENLTLASVDRSVQFGFIRPSCERSLADRDVKRYAIKVPSLDGSVQTLSGGNQQKVVLAKWLATQPKVLLLDEPTRGVDIPSKREIYAIIAELAADGLAVLVASSELPEILAIANRVLVLAEGQLTGEFARGEATEQLLLSAALPRSRSA